MSYCAKIIGSDERLIGVARLHWIVLAQGFFWFVLLALCGLLFEFLVWKLLDFIIPDYQYGFLGFKMFSGISIITWLFVIAGFFIMLLFYIKVLATEVALTSKRMIYKTGLFFVDVEEVDLEEIKSEYVDMGWFGRFLGYGHLRLDARFIGDVRLPAIRRPHRFLRAMHKARGKLTDSMVYAFPVPSGAAQNLKKIEVEKGPDEEDIREMQEEMNDGSHEEEAIKRRNQAAD